MREQKKKIGVYCDFPKIILRELFQNIEFSFKRDFIFTLQKMYLVVRMKLNDSQFLLNSQFVTGSVYDIIQQSNKSAVNMFLRFNSVPSYVLK